MSNINNIKTDTYYLETLLNASPCNILFLSYDNKIEKINQNCRNFLNIAPETIVEGKNYKDFVSNPVLVLLIKTWIKIIKSGQTVDEVFPLENHKLSDLDSSVFSNQTWYTIKGEAVFNKNAPLGYVFFISEITEFYNTKKILDTVLLANPAEIAVFDRNFNILTGSENFAKAHNILRWNKLAGRSLKDLRNFDFALLLAMLDQVIVTDKPVQKVVREQTDQEKVRWMFNDLRTITSTAGVFGYMLSRFDITPEIRPSAMLNAIMESSSEIMTILDLKGEVEYVSQSLANVLNISDCNKVIGKPWGALFDTASEELSEAKKIFADESNYKKTGSFQYKKDTDDFNFSYRVETLSYKNEELGKIFFANDTSELVNARNKAEDAVRTKTAFLTNMSHELRTPLNAVLGMSELLSRTTLIAIQKNYVSQISSSASMLLSIINDILDFSRLEDRKLVLAQETYSIKTLVREVINIIALRISEKALSFTLDIDPSVPSRLIGDSMRVKQLLINLLTNAVKFTHSGEILLAIRSEFIEASPFVRIFFSVKDTGIGIPKERQNELFKRFARIENNQTRGEEGSGLGLSICQNLVSLMNGSLHLESEEGKGSTFTAEVLQKLDYPYLPFVKFGSLNTVKLLIFVLDESIQRSLCKMSQYAKITCGFCDSLEELEVMLGSLEDPVSHVIFDAKTIRKKVSNLAKRWTNIKFLSLVSITDFVEKGKEEPIEYAYTPLDIDTFARFLKNEPLEDYSALNNLALSSADTQNPLRGKLVLVVDDNEVNRKVVEGLLKTIGIKVVESESGADALKKVRAQQFDLILMDHVMPEMDGLKTTELIRKLEAYENVPIIALTGHSGSEYTAKYAAVGMNDYITKPIQVKSFVSCIQKWLNQESLWIAGLDKKNALEFTGSEENLDRIIRIFNKNSAKLLEHLDEGKKSLDLEKLRIAVHSIIGVSANIGGIELSTMARELERAVTNKQDELIEALFLDVRSKLESIITGVKQYVEAL